MMKRSKMLFEVNYLVGVLILNNDCKNYFNHLLNFQLSNENNILPFLITFALEMVTMVVYSGLMQWLLESQHERLLLFFFNL